MTGAKTVTGLLRRKKMAQNSHRIDISAHDGVGGILHQLVEMAL